MIYRVVRNQEIFDDVYEFYTSEVEGDECNSAELNRRFLAMGFDKDISNLMVSYVASLGEIEIDSDRLTFLCPE